jgi:signal transduction histidine kinase
MNDALARLQASHDLALAVLRAEPRALRTYLDAAATGISVINSLLRVPARTDTAFRDKLERVLQEVLGLSVEAQALRLDAIAACAGSFEGSLQALRQRATLSGDDFLPLAVRLDELFTQIAAARSLDEQRATVVPPAASSSTRRNAILADGILHAGAAQQSPATLTERGLQALAARVAAEVGCDATLILIGLERVPPAYRKSVDNMLMHLVRNAIEHGIEPVAQRLASGKSAKGTVTMEFSTRADGGYELMLQDDGQGFDVERIGRVAVESGLLGADSLASTDPRKLVGLIFRPGFSTAGAAGGSGRGLGMEFLRELVTRLDGNITVSTKRGRYTRFRVSLPPVLRDTQSDAAGTRG